MNNFKINLSLVVFKAFGRHFEARALQHGRLFGDAILLCMSLIESRNSSHDLFFLLYYKTLISDICRFELRECLQYV